MEFILKWCAAFEAARAARTGAIGVAALDDEAWDQAVEDCAVIVAVEAVLEEVARCEWGLVREELEGDVAGGGVEDYFGGGLGLEIVESRHDLLVSVQVPIDACHRCVKTRTE